jgi:hypothetical protein
MSDAHVAVRSSKRKRAQVSYYEGEPDYAEDLDSEHGTEEVSPSKVRMALWISSIDLTLLRKRKQSPDHCRSAKYSRFYLCQLSFGT